MMAFSMVNPSALLPQITDWVRNAGSSAQDGVLGFLLQHCLFETSKTLEKKRAHNINFKFKL